MQFVIWRGQRERLQVPSGHQGTPDGGGGDTCRKRGAPSVQRPGDSECAFSPSFPLCRPLMGTGPLELSERLFPMGPVLQCHLLAPTATIALPPRYAPHGCCCLCTHLLHPVFMDKHLCVPCLFLLSSRAAIPRPSLWGSRLALPLVLPALSTPQESSREAAQRGWGPPRREPQPSRIWAIL